MMGQVGHDRRGAAVPAIAVLLAAVLLTAVALATLRSDTASAPTVLVEGAAATAVLPDGVQVPLEVGAQVPPGATVSAGPDGAVLRTRDRDVHLGRRTELTVLDGARQVLAAGVVMVDARRGPGVDVATEAAVVTTPDGAVSRLERGALLRVGTFAGDAVTVRPTGRRTATDLPRWTQTQVPVGGLPGRVTPLKLTGDRTERRLAPDLVEDDRFLADLGRTLDGGGAQGPAVLAALEATLPAAVLPAPVVPVAGVEVPAPGSGPASERALAFLLASAAESGAAPVTLTDVLADVPTDVLAERYAEVRALRADGGSWGPVARLVEAPVPAVSSLLDGLLGGLVLVAGELPGPIDLAALLAPAPAAVPPTGSAPVAPAPAPGTAPPPAEDAPPPPGDEDEGEDDPPGPVPPLPPPPPPLPPLPPPLPPDPVDTVEDAVDTVVDTVIGLLPELPVPTPSPTPSPSPTSGPLPVLPLG